MTVTFKGRTVKCGPHTWHSRYPILEATRVDDCICLILDYSALWWWKQADNLRGFTPDGKLLWIAEHPAPLDCYTGFLDTTSVLAYNFAGYQCLIDLASGKVIRMFFTK